MDDQPSRIWLVQRGEHQVACLARLVPYGIELDISYDGTVLVTRSFDSESEALAWAERKRRARESQGWSPIDLAPSDPDQPAS